MQNKITAALQVFPREETGKFTTIIDKAIDVIKNSGLNYMVCPFETVVEGNYDEVMDVFKQAIDACYDDGSFNVVANIRILGYKNKDYLLKDNLEKYPNLK
jgi:uncharacterized protein YqgV (UPF0045/DUF77 family)